MKLKNSQFVSESV